MNFMFFYGLWLTAKWICEWCDLNSLAPIVFSIAIACQTLKNHRPFFLLFFGKRLFFAVWQKSSGPNTQTRSTHRHTKNAFLVGQICSIVSEIGWIERPCRIKNRQRKNFIDFRMKWNKLDSKINMAHINRIPLSTASWWTQSNWVYMKIGFCDQMCKTLILSAFLLIDGHRASIDQH